MATDQREGKLWIQNCKTPLKTDLVSHPARVEGSLNIFIFSSQIYIHIYKDEKRLYIYIYIYILWSAAIYIYIYIYNSNLLRKPF